MRVVISIRSTMCTLVSKNVRALSGDITRACGEYGVAVAMDWSTKRSACGSIFIDIMIFHLVYVVLCRLWCAWNCSGRGLCDFHHGSA